MKDYSGDAEGLFRDFAERHSFIIEKLDDPKFELLMRVPQQPGLSFELTLGLQNNDELNIGFEKFWSYFFPFDKQRELVASALDALAVGDCRLAVHKQFGGDVKRVLELCTDGRWRLIYSAWSRIQIPLLGTDVSYIHNDGAQAR